MQFQNGLLFENLPTNEYIVNILQNYAEFLIQLFIPNNHKFDQGNKKIREISILI